MKCIFVGSLSLLLTACSGGSPLGTAMNAASSTPSVSIADANARKKPFATLVDNNSGDRLKLCPAGGPDTIEYKLSSVAGNPFNDVRLTFAGAVPAGAVDTIYILTNKGDNNGYTVNNVQPVYYPFPFGYGSVDPAFSWTFNPATTNAYSIVGPGLDLSSVPIYLYVTRIIGNTTYTFEVDAQCSGGASPSPSASPSAGASPSASPAPSASPPPSASPSPSARPSPSGSPSPFATLVDNNSGDRLTLCPAPNPFTIAYQLTSVAGNPFNDVHFMFNGSSPAAGTVDTVVMPTANGTDRGYVVNNQQPQMSSSNFNWTFDPATTNTYFIVGPGLTLSALTNYLDITRQSSGGPTYTFEVIASCTT